MKALSIRQPWVEMIASGEKTVEFRTWQTHYRGPLAICASSTKESDIDRLCTDWNVKIEDCVRGVLVCVVDLYKIEGQKEPGEQGEFEWFVRKPRRTKQVNVKGRLNIFELGFEPELI